MKLKPECNFIVLNEHLVGNEIEAFFDGEAVEWIEPETTMWDLLVRCGIFPSKSQARKAPKWKNAGETPKGWTDHQRIGKFNIRITVLSPMPT